MERRLLLLEWLLLLREGRLRQQRLAAAAPWWVHRAWTCHGRAHPGKQLRGAARHGCTRRGAARRGPSPCAREAARAARLVARRAYGVRPFATELPTHPRWCPRSPALGLAGWSSGRETTVCVCAADCPPRRPAGRARPSRPAPPLPRGLPLPAHLGAASAPPSWSRFRSPPPGHRRPAERGCRVSGQQGGPSGIYGGIWGTHRFLQVPQEVLLQQQAGLHAPGRWPSIIDPASPRLCGLPLGLPRDYSWLARNAGVRIELANTD